MNRLKDDTTLLATFAGVWIFAWLAAFSVVLPIVLVIHIFQFGWSPWLWASVPVGWLVAYGLGLLALRISRRGI